MGSATPQVGRLADAQESRVQVTKRSDMGSADKKRRRFADAQD